MPLLIGRWEAEAEGRLICMAITGPSHQVPPQRHRLAIKATTQFGRRSLKLFATSVLLLVAVVVAGMAVGQGVLLTLIAVAAVVAALAGSVLAVVAIVRHGERGLNVYGGLALSVFIFLLLLHPFFVSD
jgi:hypothetical protein